MRIKDFITDETPTLKSVDTALDGLDMMDDFKLRHLPLLEGGKYLCLVSERDLLAMDDLDAPIGKPLLMAPSLRPEAYLHEAMALVARYDLTLLPVVGEEGKYVGAIRVERLLREVARWCGAVEEGGVVVLDIGIVNRATPDEVNIVPDLALDAYVRDDAVTSLGIDAWEVAGVRVTVRVTVLHVTDEDEVVAILDRLSHD